MFVKRTLRYLLWLDQFLMIFSAIAAKLEEIKPYPYVFYQIRSDRSEFMTMLKMFVTTP